MISSFRKGADVLRTEGPVNFLLKSHLRFGIPCWNTITSRNPIGTNIFERDWELLVILDTCRVDTLQKAAKNTPWLDTVGSIRSVGSMSAEWMLNTFVRDRRAAINETSYVSGNIWSHRIFNERFHSHQQHDYGVIHRGFPSWGPVDSSAFLNHETVSAVANQNDRLHPENEAIPHILTDRAIAVGRKMNTNRLIVHYTLPHLTFIADELEWEPGTLSTSDLMAGPEATRELRPEERSYAPARRGEVSRKTVCELYRRNLCLALDYVEILLRNVDADPVIISADHGEGFGEHGVWGHPWGYPLSPVKEVPWATTTATDEKTYEPQYQPLDRVPNEAERRRILKDMGYL